MVIQQYIEWTWKELNYQGYAYNIWIIIIVYVLIEITVYTGIVILVIVPLKVLSLIKAPTMFVFYDVICIRFAKIMHNIKI